MPFALRNETSTSCHWNLPEAHALESWGDARAYDGTVTVMQPLIAPLYEGRSLQEVLTSFIETQNGKAGHDLVKDYWTRAHGGQVGGYTITDTGGQPFRNTDTFWTHVLHDGWIPGTGVGTRTEGGTFPRPPELLRLRPRPLSFNDPGPPPPPAPPPSTLQPPTSAAAASAASGGLEIIFRPDPTIWDGRFANNGWLQELPKPLTKITWDPTAWVSPRLAESQGLSDGDIIELKYRGNTAKLPVTIVPGHPDGAVTAFFGYGRQVAGRVGRPPTTPRRNSTSTSCAPPTRCGSAAGSRSPRPAAAT